MTAPLVSKPDSVDKKEKKKDKSPPVQTKVVIRRLPPTMTEAEFLDAISPIPDHDYIRFVKADFTWDQDAFCRAYINFIETEDIYIFQERFDGYVFVDNKGAEFIAVVEFAPSQKVGIRREGKKKDPKVNTIEQDPDYLKFLEALEKGSDVAPPSVEQNLEEIEVKEREAKAGRGPDKQTTPLLQFLKEKKEEKLKKREELKEQKKKREEERRKLRDEERLKRKEAKEKEIKVKEKEKLEKKNDSIEEDIKTRQIDRKNKRDKDKKDKEKEKEKDIGQVNDGDPIKESGNLKEPSNLNENEDSEKKDKREIEKEKRIQREEKEKEKFRKREEEKIKQREKKKELIEKRKEKEKAERKKEVQTQEEQQSRNENVEETVTSTLKDQKDNVKTLPSSSAPSAEVKEESKTKKYSDRRKEERLKREKEKMDKNKKKESTSTSVTVKNDENIIDIDEDSSKDDEDTVIKPASVLNKYETASEKSQDSVESTQGEIKKPFRERKSEERPFKERKGKRPDMQVYRPGMGKFSSRSLRKDEEDKEKSPRTSPDESRETSPMKKVYDDDGNNHAKEFKGKGSKGYKSKSDKLDDNSIRGFKTNDETKGFITTEDSVKGFKTERKSQKDLNDKLIGPIEDNHESEDVVKLIVEEVVAPIASKESSDFGSGAIRDEDITPLTAAVSVITIDNDM